MIKTIEKHFDEIEIGDIVVEPKLKTYENSNRCYFDNNDFEEYQVVKKTDDGNLETIDLSTNKPMTLVGAKYVVIHQVKVEEDENKANKFVENSFYKLYNNTMQEVLDSLEPNSIDCCITDPPYELNFMSKGWDNQGIFFKKETWQKVLNILKPGGYLLAFGGSRTYHRIACAIEDAGFEIRDCIMYLYGSGFPKSTNLGLATDKKLGVESEVVGKGKSGNACRYFYNAKASVFDREEGLEEFEKKKSI